MFAVEWGKNSSPSARKECCATLGDMAKNAIRNSTVSKPSGDYAHAHAIKERALAGLRLLQLREKRKEWRKIVDAGMAAALALTRDRLLAIPDRMASLIPEQRNILRQELTDALEAWSHAEL